MSTTSPRVLPLNPAFSPLSLTRVLWKHWMVVLLVGTLGSATSFMIIHELPPVYRSEALILIESQKIPERYVSPTVNTEVQDQLASISQQILSATRLQKIIDDFGLYREQRKRLVQEEIIALMRKDISIQLEEKGSTRDHPQAFRIGYRGSNPTLVTQVAKQLANLFIEENFRTREREAEGTAEFIDNQLKDAKQELDQLEAKVSQYKIAHNGDLPEQQNALTAALSGLQVELQGNQDAINRAQQNKVTLQGTLEVAEAAAGTPRSPQGILDATGTNTNGNPSLQKESEFLQAQYDALSKRYEPSYPKMIALQHQIEKQKMIEDAENARIENLRTQVALADREIQQRNRERENILKSIAQYQARIEQLPVREQEMAALTRDYENAKSNYKSLLEKKLAAGMATDMEKRQQSERFTMLDPPTVPEKPISPKKPLLEGIGCTMSLILGLAFVFAKEMKKNAVLGEWELPEGVELLGRVPIIKPTSLLVHSGEKSPKKWKRVLISSIGLSLLGLTGNLYLYWEWR